MSEFFIEKHIKKTRKPHECVYCQRSIPVGKSATNCVGKWQGDFQNWYADDFCFNNKEITEGCEEGISGDEFDYWIRENEKGKCPSCGDRYNTDMKWDKTREIVNFECEECETKWSVFIGFESEVKP